MFDNRHIQKSVTFSKTFLWNFLTLKKEMHKISNTIHPPHWIYVLLSAFIDRCLLSVIDVKIGHSKIARWTNHSMHIWGKHIAHVEPYKSTQRGSLSSKLHVLGLSLVVCQSGKATGPLYSYLVCSSWIYIKNYNTFLFLPLSGSGTSSQYCNNIIRCRVK